MHTPRVNDPAADDAVVAFTRQRPAAPAPGAGGRRLPRRGRCAATAAGARLECRVADDPFAVCALARDWQPFAIVLDIAMPGLDGLQLATRLRADPRTADMLLVACSAHASQRDRERAREAGFDAHCAKPLTPHRLLAYLESASGGR
jgi:CheY-like chemotaxis protein